MDEAVGPAATLSLHMNLHQARTRIRTILAIDAAWTTTEPSGVSLLQGDDLT